MRWEKAPMVQYYQLVCSWSSRLCHIYQDDVLIFLGLYTCHSLTVSTEALSEVQLHNFWTDIAAYMLPSKDEAVTVLSAATSSAKIAALLAASSGFELSSKTLIMMAGVLPIYNHIGNIYSDVDGTGKVSDTNGALRWCRDLFNRFDTDFSRVTRNDTIHYSG